MAYEKPALLILSFASRAIRSFDSDGPSIKGMHVVEIGSQFDGFQDTLDKFRDGSTATSSSSGAYEADE